ncbi:NACHT, LRR and PYD domains-containing protein 12 [Megalops cyprinoides]|uniref:NACHT, LRR and PYD domains-containing protein 12 n=1 Tax=Megalops cyprinoides TaxID=118141 RepID=UPI00186558ED|nr:NACHT, LRR and PYD domains-containing protein 12 [Megalops cyprinoides]
MSATRDRVSTPFQKFQKLHREALMTWSFECREESVFGGQGPREVVLSEHYLPLEAVEEHREGVGDSVCLQDAVTTAFSHEQDHPRVMLIVGAAGAGKTTALQKLLANWAQGTCLQPFFLLPLSCWKLNSLQGALSLVQLLLQQHSHLSPESLAVILQSPETLLFVLDGLDQYRHQLEAPAQAVCSSPEEPVPVAVLLASLAQGLLLNGASLLVSSRETAHLEPLCEVQDLCVELQGFSRERRRAFTQLLLPQEDAGRVWEHMEETLGFHSLCRQPGFCWTVCSVYRAALETGMHLPRTLTQVFVSATVSQVKHGGLEETQARALLSGLGRLASHSLLYSTSVFSRRELIACGLQPFLSSPILSAFLRIEGDPALDGGVLSFLSPALLEFLLAVSVFLGAFGSGGVRDTLETQEGELLVLFLAGLASPLQRQLLEGAVGEFSSACTQDFDTWLKTTSQEALQSYSKEQHLRCFRLLHQRSDEQLLRAAIGPSARLGLGYGDLSDHDAAALSYAVTCCGELEQLNLYASNSLSEETVLRLGPALRRAGRIILSQSSLSADAYAHLATGMCSGRALELDLSYSRLLGEQGAERLCAGLRASGLQSLRLPSCGLTAVSCTHLVSLLSAESSQLHLLDLSGNDLEDQGVTHLSTGLKSPHCHLQELRLRRCKLTGVCTEVLSVVLCSGRSELKCLELSNNSVSDEGMSRLSTTLRSPSCALQRLLVSACDLSESCCAGLAAALSSDACRLQELDLSINELEDGGVLHLCDALKAQRCPLEALRLSRCELGEESFVALATVLGCGSSRLRELDLGVNIVRDRGAKHLWNAMRDGRCSLEHLDLDMLGLTDGCLEDLSAAVRACGSLKRLILKNNELTDAAVPALVAMAQESRAMQELNLQYNDFSEDVFELMDTCGKIRY